MVTAESKLSVMNPESDSSDPQCIRGTAVRSTDLFMSSYDGFMKKHGYELGRAQPDFAQNGLPKTQRLPLATQGNENVTENLQPRALYAEWSQAGPQHLPRWPMEMQVIPEKFTHLYFPDQNKAPYTRPASGLESPPSKNGHVVYLYTVSTSSPSFQRSCVGGSPPNSENFCRHELTSSADTTLIFESRFECGNLEKAVQTSKYSYNLYLRHDLFNQQQTQWFYFRIENLRPGLSYRFSIVNLCKPHSLYRCGACPLAYSIRRAQEEKIGWYRIGQEVAYYRNLHSICIQNENVPLYTLSFTCEFTYSEDYIYLANCFPYTYSQLQEYLLALQQDACRSSLCRQRVLCWSLAGNLVPLLTITSPETTVHKRVVVLTARVHPGESNASWMMKGLLDYLTSQHPRAKTLRQLYIFKVVPMLNPDGVIVGNSRCSLTGRDLNRQYRSLLKDTFPSVWYTRQLVQRLGETNQVFLYCDMHGHSRQSNIFLYGCENSPSSPSYLQEWTLPVLMHKWAPDKFSLECCASKVQRARLGTARVTMWKLGVLNSYTLEASMAGTTIGQNGGYHFTIEDYEAAGRSFCDALYEYSMATPAKLAELQLSIRELIREEVIKIDSDLVASDGEQDNASTTEDLTSKLGKMRLKSAGSRKRSRKQGKHVSATSSR